MATIKDISQKTNLSSSAVSRILNNDDTLKVPEKTKQLVFEAAKELNYQKKARQKKDTFSNLIGIVMWTSMEREIEDPYYLAIRQGAEEYCRTHHYPVIRVYEDDINYMENLKNVSALICIGKFSQVKLHSLKKITQNLVVIDMDFNPITECHITLDFKNAIKEVVQTLHHQGHQKIGYLGGLEYLDHELYQDTRKTYFKRFCEFYHCDYQDYILEDKYSVDSGYQMAVQLIESQKLPTALFCANDLIAIGALKAFSDYHIHVPNDISIIGFDNINLINYTKPPLSSVMAPTLDMGTIGASIVIQSLETKTNPPCLKIQLPCYLIHRESMKQLD